MPVMVIHVMMSLSNHARALLLELFKEAAPEQQILKPIRPSGRLSRKENHG
jgi:hypothetical protein